MASRAPLRIVVAPDYGSPREVLGPLVELGAMIAHGAVQLFFHDETLGEDDIRGHVEAAWVRANAGAPLPRAACGDARTDDGPAFAAIFASEDGGPRPQIAKLCADLGAPVVRDRFEVEELCIARGVLVSSLERSFCMMPWRHLHIEADGVATPCCVAPIEERAPSLVDHTLAEVYSSPSMRRVRLNMLNGIRDRACSDCWNREDRDEDSFRDLPDPLEEAVAAARAMTEGDGRILSEKIAPADIDIRWSNICNFKCRMCWHRSSSSWFDDALRVSDLLDRAPGKRAGLPLAESERRHHVWGEKALVTFNTFGDALAKIAPYLDQVSHVYSAGGEPLMMDEHFALLDALRPRAASIALSYNTNLSRLDYRGRDLLAIWAPFQSVHLLLSVDGFGEVGEYVRTGFRTERFVDHLLRIREGTRQNANLTYRVAITVTNYNLFHVPAFVRELIAEGYVEGARQIYLGWVRTPMRSSALALPRALREKAALEYDALLDEIAAAPADPLAAAFRGQLLALTATLRGADDGLFEMHREEAWLWLEALDRLRATSWRRAVPHMGCLEPDAPRGVSAEPTNGGVQRSSSERGIRSGV